MELKILHLFDDLNIGGLERNAELIIINLDRARYEQRVICLCRKGPIAENLEKKGIKVDLLGIEGGLGLFKIMKLINALRNAEPDILHCHGSSSSVWGMLASIFIRIPKKIIHVQNTYYTLTFKERLKQKMASMVCDKVIAVSEAVKKCLTDTIKVKEDKIEVIYNSATDAKEVLPGTRQRIRREFSLGENTFVLGTVARLVEHKGHGLVLNAMADLTGTTDIRYLIIGDGPNRKNLRETASRLGIIDKVIFAGWRNDIKEILSALDAFVLISTLYEGLPLVLAEAASAGLPIITTDIGGNTEIVTGGVNGTIVDPKKNGDIKDAVFQLLANPREGVRMGREARSSYEARFRAEIMLSRIAAVYEDKRQKI